MKNNDWHEAYFDLVNKVECECVQQGDLVSIWDQFKAMSAELAKFKALAETLAGALELYAQWGGDTAREALRKYKEARDV